VNFVSKYGTNDSEETCSKERKFCERHDLRKNEKLREEGPLNRLEKPAGLGWVAGEGQMTGYWRRVVGTFGERGWGHEDRFKCANLRA